MRREGGELPPLTQCFFAGGPTISRVVTRGMRRPCNQRPINPPIHVGLPHSGATRAFCWWGHQTVQAAIFINHSKPFPHHNISTLLSYLPRLATSLFQPAIHSTSPRLSAPHSLIPPLVGPACVSHPIDAHRALCREIRRRLLCSSMTHTYLVLASPLPAIYSIT